MANNKNFYAGLEWALTPRAVQLVNALEAAGMDRDLAYLTLDTWVREGQLDETLLYRIEDTSNEA